VYKFYINSLRNITLTLTASLALFGFPLKAEAQIPPNIDFALGNFNNWTCWVGVSKRGTPDTGVVFGSGVVTAPIGGNAPGANTVNKSRHQIVSGSDTDFYGGFPVVAPGGGTFSMRIGSDSINAHAERVQYNVHVPAGTHSYNLQVQYAVVLSDIGGAGGHQAEDGSAFRLIAYDSASGNVIPTANNLYLRMWAIPGFRTFYNPMTRDTFNSYLPWTASTINLSGMAGKTVILECTAFACAQGGHWGYGYFDVTAAADSLIASVMSFNATGDSVTLQGPSGYRNYRWYNQDFSQEFSQPDDTARKVTLPVPVNPEYYNCVIIPYSSLDVADTIPSPVMKRLVGVGVAKTNWNELRIYPNPAITDLHISFPAPFVGTVSLFNTTGACVFSEQFTNRVAYTIPTSGFAAGSYTMVVKHREGVTVTRKVSIRQ
jgi:hypothetical protein